VAITDQRKIFWCFVRQLAMNIGHSVSNNT